MKKASLLSCHRQTRLWREIIVCVLAGSVCVSAYASAPVVNDVLASQRTGTKLVDITYALSSDTPSCTVSVQVSTNNGATYDVPATNFSGNGYGVGVTPGAGRQVVWDAAADWDRQYSTQVWLKVIAVERNTNALTFTQNTNIYLDADQGTTSSQPVYDGTNIVASCESNLKITVRKYDLNLNAVGSYASIASTNDTDGEAIADHKHIFQNNYHYLVFSIQGTNSDGGNLWLVKFDRDFTRIGITQVVTNEPPTNDMLLFGDGEYVYVGKFYPEGSAAHKIYKYDGNLNFITNYLEGTGSNNHANADAAIYLDGDFYFVSPQYVGPGANDRYYRIVYDTNFNVVQSRSVILQDDDKLGVINGLSYYNGRFIVHYLKGSNEANPIARAVYDPYSSTTNWNLIQNETVVTGSYHALHSVIVNDSLYLGYTEETPAFRGKLAKFTMNEVNPLAILVATGIGYVGPITVDTRIIGPTIKANGQTDSITVSPSDAVTITVEMNPSTYPTDVPVDWWVVASANLSQWFYMNSALQWTEALFSGDYTIFHPVYQGPLFNLSSTPVLNEFTLPPGTYDFWFAVDYPMDGILNLNGPILYDNVTVFVQ